MNKTTRLQLISRIASGGYSIIDQARDLDTGIELAIKRAQAGRVRAEEQLHREGCVLARLRHEHIVTLHEAGEDAQGGYLALEWIDGESLARRIEREPLNAATLPLLFIPLLEALEAVHDAGFAHADVNASNILVHLDGRLKLIDFGNAGALADTEARVMGGPNVGSVHHMAPELFSGQPPTVRSDLYAVGVTAYHALTRLHPFEGDTPAQVITAHLHSYYPTLPPSAVSTWVHRLLSRDPAARPASAREALQTLTAP